MSLENIREEYKNSRQSNDVKLKLNGATYRKLRSEFNHAKMGNLIKVKDGGKMNDLDEINSKYDINKPNVEYSLNKKKRWQIASELTNYMEDFSKENVDVRLYETRNRNEKKSNLIAMHKSKGDDLVVKKTYANLESIKRKEQLDEIARNNPKLTVTKTENKKHGKVVLQNEHIIVDPNPTDQDLVEAAYVQYEIEYAPKKDVLKYDMKKYTNTNKTDLNVVKNHKIIFSDDSFESSSLEEEIEENDDKNQENENIDSLNINIQDLINLNLNAIIEKNEKKEKYSNKKENDVKDKKDNKIFIDKSDEEKTENNQENELEHLKSYPISIPIEIYLKNDSIEPENLKNIFGLDYAEAFYCWPRNFSINLSKELKSSLKQNLNINLNFDIICWLSFQQILNQDVDNCTQYKVSIVSNFECESIFLENINTFYYFDIQELVKKAIQFLSTLPIEYFKIAKSDTKVFHKSSQFMEKLPNISGKNNVKSIEDLKLELLSKNLVNITKKDNLEDLNEKEMIEKNIVDVFSLNEYECILCFDKKNNLNDCLLFKNCSHTVCSNCMKAYINSRILNSYTTAGKLECPGCDCEIELSLIINFASNASLIDIYLKNTIEKINFVLRNYKWCPSPNCGKIIEIDLNSNPYGTVSCQCGFKMCLKCNNLPHFPAKCSQIANYYNELNINNDFLDPGEQLCTSTGKRCPNCNSFMEKNGGCNHMNCSVCYQHFCWYCLEKWEGHTNCKGNEKFSTVTVEFKKLRKTKKLKQHRYENSILHRQKRISNDSQRILSKNVKRLSETIKLDSDLDRNVEKKNIDSICKYLNEKRKELNNFLNQVLELINEIHFVCEHGYVLLRDTSILKDQRNQITNILKRLEVIVWSMEYNLEVGSGLGAIEDLKKEYQKGSACIKHLKKLNI